MEKPNPCILCNTLEFSPVHRKDQWHYLCCRNCRLVSIHPRPTAQMLMEYYRDYLPDRPADISKAIRKTPIVRRLIITGMSHLARFQSGFLESTLRSQKGCEG